MTLNGTTVSEWRSKAGSHALSQATGSAQPTLTENYYAGRSALTFDGNDVLSTASNGISIAPSTSFILFDELARVDFGGLLVGSPSSGDDFATGSGRLITTVHDPFNSPQVMRRAASPNAAAGTALIADVNVGITSAYGKQLFSNRTSSSTSTSRIKGINGTSDTAHTQAGVSSGTVVGGRYIGGVTDALYRFNGRICEILHYSRELTLSETQLVEKWLANRWGVTL